MPYDIDWNKHGVLVQFSRAFTREENSQAKFQVFNDIRSNYIIYIIWDLSVITEQFMTEKEMDIPAMVDKLVSSRIPNIKMALVAKDEKSKGLFSQYVAQSINLQNPWAFSFFDNVKAAEKWVSC